MPSRGHNWELEIILAKRWLEEAKADADAAREHGAASFLLTALAKVRAAAAVLDTLLDDDTRIGGPR